MRTTAQKIVAAVIAMAACLSTAQPAHASQGRAMVTFGDSFTANGGAPGERGAASPYNPVINIHPCSNDTRNWAHQTANNLRLDIADYSCNGTNYNLDFYVNDAIKTGNIGPDTKEVVLMYGGLQPDTYVDTLANAALPNIPKGSNYRGFLDFQFRKIRHAAPNARITMVNYVPMTVNDTLCAVNENVPNVVVNVPNVVVPITIPGATFIEDEFNREIGRAANALGVNFINLHDQAKTHDPCQPDPAQRWAVAAQTPTAPSVMPLHPTDVGHDGMARIITRELEVR